MEAITSWLIEGDSSIITSSHDVGTPGQGVRNGRVVDLLLSLGIQVERDERVVQEARHNAGAVWRRAEAHHKRFLSEKGLTLVGLCDTDTDLALSCTDDKIVRTVSRPSHAGH